MTGHLSGATAKVDKAIRDGLTVRDPDDPIVAGRKGRAEPDPDLRDQEDVPLPYAANLEILSLPGVDKIVKAVRAVMA